MTEAQKRRERVLAWLKDHPDSTAREVADALFPEEHPSTRGLKASGILRVASYSGLCHVTGDRGGQTWRVS